MFPAGNQHLNGERALILAEGRIPTVFQRTKDQNIVLRGLRDKLLSPSVFPQLPKLITAFKSSTQTDLTPHDFNRLLCLAEKVTGDDVVFVSFPDALFKPSSLYDPWRKADTFIWDVDFGQLQSLVTEFMNGTWPAP